MSNPPPPRDNVYGSRPTTPITLTRVTAVLSEAPGPDCSEEDIVRELKDAVHTFVHSGDRFARASAVLRDAGCLNITAADMVARPQAAARRAGDKALLVEALTEVLVESPPRIAVPELCDESMRSLQNQVDMLTHQLGAARVGAPALAPDPLMQAERLFLDKDYENAEQVIRNALLLDPHRTALHQLLGKTLNRLNRVAEAERYLTTALRLDASHVDTQVELGKTLYHLGRDNEAEKHLRSALQNSPNHAEATTTLGMALLDWAGTSFERSQLGVQAEGLYRDILRGNPDNSQALFGLGRAFMVQGRDKRMEAERFLRAALTRDSRNPSIKAALAMCIPHTQESNLLLEEAIQAAPNVPRFACAMGLLLDKQNRSAQAGSFLRQAHEAQSSAVKFTYALGEYMQRRFDAGMGLKYLEAAAQADNTNARVHLALADCLRKLQRPVESEQALCTVLASIPFNSRAVEMMATLLIEQGRLDEAEPFLRNIFRRHSSSRNRLRLAACLLALKRPDETEELLQSNVAPLYATRRSVMLGKSFKLRGRFAEALTFFEQLTTTDPTKAEHHREAGHALMQLGRLAEAEPYLQTAVRLQGDVGTFRWKSNRELLAQLFWCQGRLDEAERSYRHERQRGGQHADGFAWFGERLLDAGRYQSAEQYATVAMGLNEDEASYRVLLGRAHFLQGHAREALSYFIDGVQASPQNGLYHEQLARCYAALGQTVSAERSYRNAIRYGNNSAATREGLSRARMAMRAVQPTR